MNLKELKPILAKKCCIDDCKEQAYQYSYIMNKTNLCEKHANQLGEIIGQKDIDFKPLYDERKRFYKIGSIYKSCGKKFVITHLFDEMVQYRLVGFSRFKALFLKRKRRRIVGKFGYTSNYDDNAVEVK